MKKLHITIGVAAVLLAGLLASMAITSTNQVGIQVSDAEASKIMGGCNGTTSANCSGVSCTATTVISACDTTNGSKCPSPSQNVSGNTTECAGEAGNCSDCYSTATACQGG